MEKREECRNCGAELKHDKTSDQYDPEYCSGKCRKLDGAEPYVKSPAEQAAVVEVVSKTKPASLEDYKKNVPSKYTRRFEPEKLNWSKNEMNEDELKQAGFRANRRPIPGDWDYEVEATEDDKHIPGDRDYVAPKEPTEWDGIRRTAKDLGIKTFSKTRPQVEAEIKEAQNV